MKAAALAIALLGTTASWGQPAAPVPALSFAEHQAQCAGKEGWSDPAPPAHIFGNVYDIGTCGITVLLIAGRQGHVVIDSATAEAVPSILANIRRLGFRPANVKLLLTSHEHYDHVGGLSALQQATGARLVATAPARPGLETGRPFPGDPQTTGLPPFPGTRVSRVVRDGEDVRLGALRLTAHVTPGHAPGSTSWSWRACEGAVCHAIVYADSLSAVSDGAYRFTDHPDYVASFRKTFDKVAALPCDLILTPHPSASDLYQRLAGIAPLSAPSACVAYAATFRAKLDKRLADEAKAGRSR